jgi:tRNA threonylcarbamoyladenosine biosynthesis protein TsaE
LRFRCWGIEATLAAAQALAQSIGAEGLVLGLIGPLGAGKTAFAKGLAGGLGVDPTTVSSPTFVIANEYAAHGRKLAHVDLYRLESAAQLDDIGFVDMLDPGAVVVVEWADRLPDALPADRLELRISRQAEAGEAAGSDAQESRSFSASATRQGSQRVLEAWQELLRGLPGVEML